MLKSFLPLPLQIATQYPMSFWLDASNLTSIVSSSNLVSNWLDLSGNKRSAVQGTSGQRPNTGITSIAGLNVIDFNGSNQNMGCGSGLFPNLTNGSFTFFFVGKGASPAPSVDRIIFGATTQRIYLGQNSGTNYLTATFGPGTPLVLSAPGSGDVTSPFIAMMSYNGNTDLCSFSVNNSIPLTGTKDYSAAPSDAWISCLSGSANFWPGSIAEIIIYSSLLPNNNILSITQYLSQKWKVAIA